VPDVRVLVVNAGSSTLKLSVVDAGAGADEYAGGITGGARRLLDRWNGDPRAIGAFAEEHGPLDAVGHRVVHGGVEFTAPVVVDERVVARLGVLTQLAPLHQPGALAAIGAARAAVPAVPHVACFDTAFHATIPPAAHVYALPESWRARWPLRRFGFHGLSHAWAARRAAQLAGRPAGELQMVTCHLGAGASLCAVREGRSVDTTMGFTPLEGLVMATRAGSVDPGLVLWLLGPGGLGVREVSDALERESGLVGLAGTGDMREVLTRRAGGDERAVLAFDAYAHRLRRELGAMRAALDRCDAVVFTGGVGEHAADVRAACGLELDAGANARTTADGEVGRRDAAVRVFVVTAREDLEIARQVRTLLG
jgi:acetate kinase